MELDSKQREAVDACIERSRRVVAVTGKAGTGKSTIIKTACELLEEAGFKTALGAPTGKAARRVREVTDRPALTLHMLLEFTTPGEPDPKTGKPTLYSSPRRHRGRPLDCDVLLVDEYAMVNKDLHGDTVSALKPGARLLTFGDINQLPPIETDPINAKTPSKFKELIDKFNGITLETIHRTGDGSGIAENGSRVLRGMAPLRKSDFSMDMTNTPVAAVLSYIKENKDIYRSTRGQIITPSNVTWVGSYKLNVAVQSMLQPSSKGWFPLARHEWEANKPVNVCVGDKVVVTKNLYSINANDGSMGVFNGETGIILRIDAKAGDIEIDFGDRIAVFPPMQKVQIGGAVRTVYPHRELALAYVLTTHKMQGSECDDVVYVMNRSQFKMLNRYNLYTGITRARKHVHMITDMPSLTRACMNTETNF